MIAHQIDSDGYILNTIVVDALNVFPNLVDASIGGSIGDRIINGVLAPKALEPTQPPTPSEVEEAVQASLDQYAASWGYNDIASACTYVGDPCEKFNGEAILLRAWRSSTWLSVEQTDAAIKSGTSPYPATISAALALLPAPPIRPV